MRGSTVDMPVTMEEAGVVIRDAVWDDIHVSFERFTQPFDSRPLHKGHSGDSCACPHWGYVIKGRLQVIYKDREEVLQAGDAYYMAPGHNAIYEAGTETVEFSPNREFQEAMELVMRNLAAIKQA
jgi:hypothetical protein